VSENRWALLVGGSHYDGHPELKYAAADAVEFAQSIVENLGFDRNRMLLLVDSDDSYDYRPTRRDLFHALGLFGMQHSEYHEAKHVDPIGEDDLFLFYFSGHGLRTSQGEELLLPVDASKYSVPETAVPLKAVVDRIERLPCRHKVLFLDACRDELYQDEGAKSAGGSKGIGQASVVEREGLATFYSCDPGDRSYEIDDLKHGSFTYCLLEAIAHPQVNTLAQLDDYLKSRVPKVNTKSGKAPQQPFSVPYPVDMMQLALFQAARRDLDEDLVAMTNELHPARLDYEWWDKLSGIWESGGNAPNYELKKAIFLQFYREDMSLEELAVKWRRAERPALGVAPPRPEILSPQKPGGGETTVFPKTIVRR
jgi:uncharacterized caspase-like protein